MLKSVICASLLLVSQVFAGHNNGDDCLKEDFFMNRYVCASNDHTALLKCRFMGTILDKPFYKWLTVVDCASCCEPNNPGEVAYCADSDGKCDEEQEIKQPTCHVQKIYNRFRRE